MIESPPVEPKKPTWRLRLILLGSAIVLLGAALAVGINDNPPGLALAFLAGVAVVLALVAGLRTKRHYELLLLVSLLSFVGAAVLHNVLEAAGSMTGVPFLRAAGELIGVAFFLVAIFLCPAGIIVGVIGYLVMAVKRKPSVA
jgi:hypothetical protein